MTASAVALGQLHVIAMPIGNLRDPPPQADAALAAVDRIGAEDTRTAGAMLMQNSRAASVVMVVSPTGQEP